MTTQEKEQLLNEYYGVISENKWYLSNTDYQTLRETEGGEPMSEEVKVKRAEARATINEYQAKVKELEAVVPEDPMPEDDMMREMPAMIEE